MSHGQIAGFDSFLRSAWFPRSNANGEYAKYPLSAALYASSSLKGRLPAQVVVEGKVTLRRVFSGI